jgi:hypothetical protein
VNIKTEIYMKRYRAEYGNSQEGHDFDNEEALRHDIEKIREELFSLPFEESGKEIVSKF